MNWQENKKFAKIHIELINEYFQKQSKSTRLTIEESYSGWKSVYEASLEQLERKVLGSQISEGFKTWKELEIFLSGFRKALLLY